MSKNSGRHTDGAFSEAMKGQHTPIEGFAHPYKPEPVSQGKRDTTLDAGGSSTPSKMTTK